MALYLKTTKRETVRDVVEGSGLGFSGAIVTHLLKNVDGKYGLLRKIDGVRQKLPLTLTFDNFFTSPQLLLKLRQKSNNTLN